MKFLNKLERKHPRWGIENLMMHISIITALVFVIQYVFGKNIIPYLLLNREAVINFELWRLLTFIFIPPTNSLIWIFLTLYLYYFIGSALEHEWGALKFNIYYLLCLVSTVIAAMLTGGYYDGFYVNLSMFLAFAYLYPNQEFLLFFILPVKVKYFAYLDIAFLAYNFFSTRNISVKFSILASLAGFLLFFGNDIYKTITLWLRKQKYRRQIK